MIHREPTEWCDIVIRPGSSSDLPRVLLIGDSITRAYHAEAERLMADFFACARLATSKSVCDPDFVRELALVLDDYRYEIIHINNGLHGWDYTEPDYGLHVDRVLAWLRLRQPQARLIWALTTPVRDPNDCTRPVEIDTRVRERNRLAAECAAHHGAAVNDLYALFSAHPEWYGGDGLHGNQAGDIALGRHVASTILAHGSQI